MNQFIFKKDLVEHSKDLIPIIQRGYLIQGIRYSREEVYEDLLTLWGDVYGRRAGKESIFEKTSRVLEEDIEEHIIGPLEEMIENNSEKNLIEEAQKLVTWNYGEGKEDIYKLIINKFPADVFVYQGINNTSPKWIINRIKEIIFATEGVKEKQFKKQLEFLRTIRNSWFFYWADILND